MTHPGYNLGDTIVALSTPPGRGALGIVRLSGPDTWPLLRRLVPGVPAAPQPRLAYVQQALIPAATAGAEPISSACVVLHWQAPLSYTGEDMAELSLHGNPTLLNLAQSACMQLGARQAEAGEFTYRAFMNGKLDLAQAEAVQDLISADGVLALRLAATALLGNNSRQVSAWDEQLTGLLAGIEVFHDYAADDLDSSVDPATVGQRDVILGEVKQLQTELAEAIAASARTAPLRDGVTVALCGPPNAGKSTLFNALLGHARAITSPQPGTTRDYITATIEAEGLRVTLIDTAGIRSGGDAIESSGVELARAWSATADLVLWLVDARQPEAEAPTGLAQSWNVLTHCDLLPGWPQPQSGGYCVSGATGAGVPELRQAMVQLFLSGIDAGQLQAFTSRQTGLLQRCLELCHSASQAIERGLPLDAAAADLHAARKALQGIAQQHDRDAVLAQLFSRFCVGK